MSSEKSSYDHHPSNSHKPNDLYRQVRGCSTAAYGGLKVKPSVGPAFMWKDRVRGCIPYTVTRTVPVIRELHRVTDWHLAVVGCSSWLWTHSLVIEDHFHHAVSQSVRSLSTGRRERPAYSGVYRRRSTQRAPASLSAGKIGARRGVDVWLRFRDDNCHSYEMQWQVRSAPETDSRRHARHVATGQSLPR